jgi:hypothetical protein
MKVTLTEVSSVLYDKRIRYAARVIWAKMAMMYGLNNPVRTTRVESARDCEEKLEQFLVQYNLLRRMGGLTTRSIYEKGKLGIQAVEIKIIPPQKWKKTKAKNRS